MKKIVVMGLVVFVISCGGSSSGTSDEEDEGDTQPGIQFESTADFSSSAAATLIDRLIKGVTTGQCSDLPDLTFDDPILEDGLDCDEDGGVVAHITPSVYKLALKRVTLVPTDVEGEDAPAIDLVANTGTLAESEVLTFTADTPSENVVTIDSANLTEGSYGGAEIEIYFFEFSGPVSDVERNVRIYMSDDDFEAEGSLGHHQGDITFIDDDEEGTELGFIDYTWSDTLAESRGDDQNGAGGVDAETGHERGFFGNEEFWNQDELDQGDSQDIYVTTLPFDPPLEIPDPGSITTLTTITATISVADTFYYEDFEPQNTDEFPGFFPDTGGEATSESAEWAPLPPSATLTVSEEEISSE